MPQFKITIIPNCIGPIPIEFAIGRSIGVAISIIGAISIIHPSISKIRLSKSARIIGLLVNPVIALAAISGT